MISASRSTIAYWAAAFTALTAFSAAHAQVNQNVPSAADVSRVRNDRGVDLTPRSGGAPIQNAVRTTIDPAAEKQFFVLSDIAFEGVTAYPQGAFRDLYGDKIGQKVSVADIQRIAVQITNRYRADGYVLALASVPTQTVKTGTIKVVVNEGHVANVYFEGDAPADSHRGLIRDYAEKIKAQNPLKSDALERYLLLINDIPGTSAKAVLKPSTTERGASDIVILINNKPIDVVFDSNSRGSPYLGPWQNTLTVTENSQLGLGERTTLRALVTGEVKELRYGEFIHELPVGNEGTKIALSGSISHSAPGDSISPLQVRGRTEALQLRATHPFLRSRLENFTGRVTLDGRNNETDVFIDQRQSADRVRSLRLGGTFDITDSWQGINVIDAEISQGLDIFGATPKGSGRTRSVGEQEYTKFNIDASRTQVLPYNFSLYLATSAQYANDPLLASEQFIVGGPAFGTAYDPGELSGDHGLAGKIELRYGQSLGYNFLNSYQFYGYYDAAQIWRREPLASEQREQSLSSTGVGIRTNFTPNLAGNFEVAFPLSHDIASRPGRDTRFFGGVTVRY